MYSCYKLPRHSRRVEFHSVPKTTNMYASDNSINVETTS